MNDAISFTVGFSYGVEWGWPIAVYLLLAGISGGAMIISIVTRHFKQEVENSALTKAGSLVGFATIVFGMVFLVGDLEKPLYFWKILINYNFKSVMSIGVIAISFYIPLTAVMFFYAFEKEILKYFGFLSFLVGILRPLRPYVEFITLWFAIAICAYTGFLISVLIRFPLLNTALLPALFVVSGLSAGNAASGIIATKFFKEDLHSFDMKILHRVEWPIMIAEVLLIVMLAVSLLIGNEYQKEVFQAFTSSQFSLLFWGGVVGLSFIVPIVFNLLLGRFTSKSAGIYYMTAISVICGVLSLRMFLLYAGQTFGA